MRIFLKYMRVDRTGLAGCFLRASSKSENASITSPLCSYNAEKKGQKFGENMHKQISNQLDVVKASDNWDQSEFKQHRIYARMCVCVCVCV